MVWTARSVIAFMTRRKREMTNNQNERVIQPGDRLSLGTFDAIRLIYGEILSSRSHIATSFAQDFRGLYHGTFFGVVWNVILPIAPILLYSLLASQRVVPVFEGVDPSTYVALGVTIWFFLSGCVQQPLQMVRARNSEVMKTALPLSAMVFSGFGQLMFDTLVRLCFVVCVMLYTGTTVSASVVLVPLILLPGAMFFLGLGMVLGISNLIFGDVGRVTNIILQYGLFLSGVIFPIASLPFSDVLAWNPFYVYIEWVRVLTFRGLPADWMVELGYAVGAVAMFLYGGRLFYVMEYRVRGLT